MTVNKLDTSGLNQSHLADAAGVKRSRPQDQSAGTRESANQHHIATVSDHADISDNARKMVDLKQAVDTGRAALELAPEVRDDKVAQARERLASGFYNSAEVRDQVASRISTLVLEGGLF